MFGLHASSVISDSATPRTAAPKTPLSMGFLRHEYWSGLPFPPPGYLPNLGIKPMSPGLAGRLFSMVPWCRNVYSTSIQSVSTLLIKGSLLCRNSKCYLYPRQEEVREWGKSGPAVEQHIPKNCRQMAMPSHLAKPSGSGKVGKCPSLPGALQF